MVSFIDSCSSSSNCIDIKSKRKSKRKGNNCKKEISKSLIPCSSSSYSLTIHSCDAAALLPLPEDILILILNKLDVVSFHRFSAACRFWHSVAAAAKKIQTRTRRQNQFLLKSQFPWLMLSFDQSKHDPITETLDPLRHSHNPYHHRGFFSAFHGKVFRLGMPSASDSICCGSNLGWLIIFWWVRGRMFLFNPFTGVRIELPHKSTLPRPDIPAYLQGSYYNLNNNNWKYVSKFMLLSPPAASVATTNHSNSYSDDGNNNNIMDDCLVIALYMNLAAFCRPGDKSWTVFREHPVRDDFLRYEDFIVYDGKLYAIKYNYDLVLVELCPGQPKETSCNIAPPPVEQVDIGRKRRRRDGQFTYLYLVECNGELLMVIRWVKTHGGLGFGCNAIQTTLMLEIFKLETQHLRWVKVRDLGDQMLFVGASTSFSLSSLHCPGCPEFRGNCIYFTDGYLSGNCVESGVFHLEDNSVEPFYTTDSHESLPIWFPPISW